MLFGVAIAAIGLGSLRFSTAPYAPAVKAGYPKARTLVSNGPWPLLAISAGLAIAFGAFLFWFWKTIQPRPASALNPPAHDGSS